MPCGMRVKAAADGESKAATRTGRAELTFELNCYRPSPSSPDRSFPPRPQSAIRNPQFGKVARGGGPLHQRELLTCYHSNVIRLIPRFSSLSTVLIAALLSASSVRAQDEQANPPQVTAAPQADNPSPLNPKALPAVGNFPGVTERSLPRNVWADQKHIWGAPFRRGSYRLAFILPFAAGATALIATDAKVSGELTERPPGTGFDVSNGISHMGSAGAVIGFPAACYAISRLTHKETMRETSLLAFEALADSGIVAGVLKAASQRERPATLHGVPIDNARGRFWAGGADFPSGHAISMWTLASVFSERYPDKPAMKYAAYGLAGLVSVSRLTARQHFPSDILVGSVLGYLIGHYVVRAHRK